MPECGFICVDFTKMWAIGGPFGVNLLKYGHTFNYGGCLF